MVGLEIWAGRVSVRVRVRVRDKVRVRVRAERRQERGPSGKGGGRAPSSFLSFDRTNRTISSFHMLCVL